jgi:hypothetical protein
MPIDPQEFFKRRSEMGPAARLVPSQAANLQTERKQEMQGPPPETVKREEPSKMEYKVTGLQRGPDMNGPGFTAPRPVRVQQQQPQQAIAVAQRMEKVDPLEKFLAGRLKQNMPGPAEKLAMGHTRGMQM